MMLKKLRELRKLLDENNDFGESILESIVWENLLTTVSIKLLVPQFSGDRPVQFERFDLKFHITQSFKFIGGITDFQVQSFDKLNWGLNEIALIRIDHDSYELVDYMDYETQFFRARLRWSGGTKRHIEIIFARLEVHSELADPDIEQ